MCSADSAFFSYRHCEFCVCYVSLFSSFTKNSEADVGLANVQDFRACLYPGCVLTSLLSSVFRLVFLVHLLHILSHVYPCNVL